MKKLFCIISTCLCLISCSDDVAFSCDRTIDEWVHENLSDIRTMTRSEWSAMEEDLKIPVYRAFTLQQKIDFWNEKFVNALELNWSEEERNHITQVLDFANKHPNIMNGYSVLSDEDKNAIDIFFYKWQEIAETELKWSRELIYALVASGNTILDTKGTLLVTTEQFDGRSMFLSSSESICNCSISNDWCTPNNVDCEEVDCETTDGGTLSGCGLLLLYDCNGRCGGI